MKRLVSCLLITVILLASFLPVLAVEYHPGNPIGHICDRLGGGVSPRWKCRNSMIGNGVRQRDREDS